MNWMQMVIDMQEDAAFFAHQSRLMLDNKWPNSAIRFQLISAKKYLYAQQLFINCTSNTGASLAPFGDAANIVI